MAAIAADLGAADRPGVLVLDDVHEIAGEPAVDVVDRLLDALPDGWIVVIATRAEPGIRRARRMVADQIVELGVEDLRLDDADGHALLRRTCPDLDDDTAMLALARADGWAAGIALTGLALAGADDPQRLASGLSAADRPIAEYLRTEVLAHVAPDEREFLVRTSVLETLSSPLCDAVLDSAGSHEILERLAASGNLFVAGFDDGGVWYRYHHLWRQLLLVELRVRRADEEPELRRRAAAWLDANGETGGVVQQLLAVGDRTAAAAVVGREIGLCVLGGRVATLGQWLSWFTTDEVRVDAGLVLASAWAATLGGDTDAVHHWLGVLDGFAPDTRLADGTTLRGGRAAVEMLTGYGGTKGTILAVGCDRRAWSRRQPVVDGGPPARGRGAVRGRHVDDPDAEFAAVERDARSDPGLLALCRAHRAVLAAVGRAVEGGRRAVRRRPRGRAGLGARGLPAHRDGVRRGRVGRRPGGRPRGPGGRGPGRVGPGAPRPRSHHAGRSTRASCWWRRGSSSATCPGRGPGSGRSARCSAANPMPSCSPNGRIASVSGWPGARGPDSRSS